MIVPDREPDYPEAMRRHLREMQRSVQGCRNISAQNSVWQPLNTRDSVVFRTHFADPCVDRGTSQRCTTIGLFLRRVGARWYIDAVDRGVCLEAP